MAANLIGQLINNDTIAQLAKGTKADEGQVESLLSSALPLLMQNMATNASTKEGKASLSKALDQHASGTTNVTTLLKQADTNDGEKILGHILGGNKSDVTSALAKKSGLSNKDTLTLLATLAPVLLSLLGDEKKKSSKEDDGLDLGDLISVMGGLSGKKKGSNLGNMLELAGGLLGEDTSSNKKKKTSSGGIDLLDLAGELLVDDSSSKKKKKKSSDNTAEVVGDLLGKLLK